MFTGKGDGNVTAAAIANGVGGKSIGGNFSAEYAITNNIGIGVQHYTLKDRNDGTDRRNPDDTRDVRLNYRRQLTTGNLVFYGKLNRRKSLYGELLLGYGEGRYQIRDRQTDTTRTFSFFLNSRAKAMFFQPGIYFDMWDKSEPVRFGATLRVGRFIFSDINTNYDQDDRQRFFLDSLDVSPFFFLEPAFTIRGVLPKMSGLEIVGQFGLSLRTFGPKIRQRGAQISLGVNWSLGNFKRQRKGVEAFTPLE
jgi:hypothetical protein